MSTTLLFCGEISKISILFVRVFIALIPRLAPVSSDYIFFL